MVQVSEDLFPDGVSTRLILSRNFVVFVIKFAENETCVFADEYGVCFTRAFEMLVYAKLERCESHSWVC